MSDVREGTRPQAAFFDLDRTLISGSSAFPFAIAAWRHKMMPTSRLIGDAAAALAFRIAGASDDRSAALRDRILGSVAGREESMLRGLGAELVPRLIDSIRPEARELLDMHVAAGRDVYVVSASPIEIVTALAEAIGIAGGIGTRGEVVDGRYTGKLTGDFCYGEGKAAEVLKLSEARGYDLLASYAYSDSASDLPMMELVGHPVAVNPDRPLEEVARRRGWPIVVFRRRAKAVARATTAIAGSVALAGVSYVVGRRHGRRHEVARVGPLRLR